MLGIDIASGSLSVVELSHHKKYYRVQHHSSTLLSADLVSNGQINDIDEVVKCFKTMIKGMPVSCKHVALAIPDILVMRKVVQMSGSLAKQEIEALVSMEVEHSFSTKRNDLCIDFHILSKSSPQTEMLNVLIVAAQADSIRSRLSVISRLGLRAAIVDIESSAVARVYQQWLLRSAAPEQWVQMAVQSVDRPLRLGDRIDSTRLMMEAPHLITACGLALRTRYAKR